MRPIARRYLQFLLSLIAGLLAASFGAVPAGFLAGMPGTDRVGMDLVWFGLGPAGALGALGFRSLGRLAPLRVSLARTALAAAGAVGACAALLRLAAQAPWMTGDDALLLTLAGMATLGFVPFVRPAAPRVVGMHGEAGAA